MAVYTQLTQADIESFLAQYEVGELASFKGIAEGVENSNYLIATKQPSSFGLTAGSHAMGQAPLVKPKDDGNIRFILTLFEQRVNPADLPFFMRLTEWLADRGIVCPRPVRGRDGEAVRMLKGKPAALIFFLEGRGSPHITPLHMQLVGGLVARMHLAAQDFPMERPNALSLAGWRALFERFRRRADEIAPGLESEIARELDFLEAHWPKDLPQGVIHADLFPDNIFFIDGNTYKPELSGVIDFYFACNDFWMYDLIICLNAWCFDTGHRFAAERAKALLQSYNAVRPVTQAERDAMPIMGRGAALRFLLTRSYDWLNTPRDALVTPKDPLEYTAKLRYWQEYES